MQKLITKYFEGQLTLEEKQELFSYIQTNDTWRKEFVSMQNLYGITSWLPNKEDEAEAISKLLAFKQTRKKEEGKIRRMFRRWGQYAAVIAISVLSSWLFFEYAGWDTDMDLANVEYEEFTAPAGQRALLKLQDGTTVWLNAKTTIRYPNRFSKTERKVELNGEAFFEVKENKKLPFIVTTEKLSVKVTGTKFNVFAYNENNEFSTSLTEGTVLVYNPKNEHIYVELKANERAILEDSQLRKESFSNMDFLLWKNGIYAFDDLPFHKIAAKLELFYDTSILIKNQSLESYRFSGKFRQRDGIESVLKRLQNIKEFSYTKDEEKNAITIQ